jgi:hypothetical protein
VANPRLLQRTFQFAPIPVEAYTNSTTVREFWWRTPSLSVVAVPMGYQKGHELRSLQHAYGEALVRAEPTHGWPACGHMGMAMLFAAAELTAPNHFYLSGEKIFGHEYVWDPERMLIPTGGPDQRMPTEAYGEWGYSCYLLSFMIASATPEKRSAFERMLTAVGNGTPLGAAISSELQQTLPEFTANYQNFSNSVVWFSNQHQVRVDLPGEIPAMPEPTPISLEEMQSLLGRLCSKLNNCRK